MTPFMTPLESREEDGRVARLDPKRVRAQMGDLVLAQEQLRAEVMAQVAANHARIREVISKGTLPSFE